MNVLPSAAILACLVLGTAQAGTETNSPAASTCGLWTLHGTMAWSAGSSSAAGPSAGSGMESYDGKGHMKYYEYWSDGTTSYTSTGTGTYAVAGNCIATVTYYYDGVQSGNPWTYFVSPDGSKYYWNNNQNNGTVSFGVVERITEALLIN